MEATRVAGLVSTSAHVYFGHSTDSSTWFSFSQASWTEHFTNRLFGLLLPDATLYLHAAVTGCSGSLSTSMAGGTLHFQVANNGVVEVSRGRIGMGKRLVG